MLVHRDAQLAQLLRVVRLGAEMNKKNDTGPKTYLDTKSARDLRISQNSLPSQHVSTRISRQLSLVPTNPYWALMITFNNTHQQQTANLSLSQPNTRRTGFFRTNVLVVDRWLSQEGRRVSPGDIERPIRRSTRRGHGTRRVKVLGLTPLFGESLSLVHGAGNRLVLVVQVLSLR